MFSLRSATSRLYFGPAVVAAALTTGALASRETPKADASNVRKEQPQTKGIIGVFLDEESVKNANDRFAQKHERKFTHHITLHFNPSEETQWKFEPLMNTLGAIDVVGYAEDDYGQAILVDIKGAGGNIECAGHFPHITLSTSEEKNVGPVYSNLLFARLAAEGVIKPSNGKTISGANKNGKSEWKGTLPAFAPESGIGAGSSYDASPATYFRIDPPLKLTGIVCDSSSYDDEKKECCPVLSEATEGAADGETKDEAAGGVDEGEKKEGEGEGEGGEEDEDELPECGFCLFMRAGPCGDEFRAWEKCLEVCREEDTDFVNECGGQTMTLKECIDLNPEYYAPLTGGDEEDNAEAAAAKESEGGEGGEGGKDANSDKKLASESDAASS